MTSHDVARQRWLDTGMDGSLSRPITVPEFREQMQLLLSAVNISQALAALGGDEALLHELISYFAEDSAASMNEIGAAISDRNFLKLESRSHSLVGLLALFGATSAKILASRLEELGKSQVLRDAEQLFSDLEVAVGRVRFVLELKIRGISP